MLRINNEPMKGTWAQSVINNFLLKKQNFVSIKDSNWTINSVLLETEWVTIIFDYTYWRKMMCIGISMLIQDCTCVYI